MKKVIIACAQADVARFKVEAAGVNPRHPRLHYAIRPEAIWGMPIGVHVVDLTAGATDTASRQLRRDAESCQPVSVELASLAATLARLDEVDAAGAAAVALDLDRAQSAEIAARHDKADLYAARADAHERRHEYAEAEKLRGWARRERTAAGELELAKRLNL